MTARSFRWLAAGVGVLVALSAVVLLVVVRTLGPPAKDLLDLALFLLASGGITLGIGYVVARFGLGRMLRTIRGKLVLIVILAVVLALVNIAFTAHLMFISAHDLGLLSVLLAFALGMSVFFAYALSQSFSETVGGVVRAVRRMGAGDLSARVSAASRDEMEEVARAFNAMAEQLEAAFEKQKGLEQARRELVAAVSHDLRSPLASMRAMVESMNDGVVSDPETVRRYLHTLQTEIEYLSRLINDLFDLSQIDAGLIELQRERASLSDLISDTLESVSAQALQRGLTVRGEVDQALPAVVMDARRVQRVLYNLLQNALRHTPADGSIVIRAVDAGPEVCVSVADTGEGIPADQLARIFERFHRGGDKARSRGAGRSGLGLSIAKGIVEAHGGRIWAESAPGHGATVTFSLPKPA